MYQNTTAFPSYLTLLTWEERLQNDPILCQVERKTLTQLSF